MKKRFNVSDMQEASELLNYIATLKAETKTLKEVLANVNKEDLELLLGVSQYMVKQITPVLEGKE